MLDQWVLKLGDRPRLLGNIDQSTGSKGRGEPTTNFCLPMTGKRWSGIGSWDVFNQCRVQVKHFFLSVWVLIWNDGAVVVFRSFGRNVPAVDQSQRSGLCYRSPKVDICLSLPAASLRHFRRVLLCEGLAHFQDVLCTETTRAARARHPATGE